MCTLTGAVIPGTKAESEAKSPKRFRDQMYLLLQLEGEQREPALMGAREIVNLNHRTPNKIWTESSATDKPSK